MANAYNPDVSLICRRTGQEADVIVWNKEIWWKGYSAYPRVYNGELDLESWDFHDDDYVDNLATEYQCRSCDTDEIRNLEEHFTWREIAAARAAATHGGRL